jgi:hypothetical protein
VGFHKCSIDVVRRDCLHCTLPDFQSQNKWPRV